MEALVAVVIIGITLAGTFGAMARAFDLIEESRDRTRVAQIIQSELEDLRTLSWAEVDALRASNPGWFTPNSSFSSEFGSRYQCYRQILVGSHSDQFTLRVWVRWTNNSGHTKWDYFQTFYTEGGFNDYYYRSF